MKEVPEDWVLREAMKRFEWGHFHIRTLRTTSNPGFRALCEMIAKYEQPPVDPDVEAVKRIVSAWSGTSFFRWEHCAQLLAAAVAQYKLERSK